MSVSGAISAAAGALGNALEKITILHETVTPSVFDGKVTALFNPAQLQYAQEVSWTIEPITGQSTLAGYHQIYFCAANPRTLSLDLFFDTYEGDPTTTTSSVLAQAAATVVPLNPFNTTPTGVSVLQYTAAVSELANVQQELHQPPVCQLWWGRQLLLQGVLTSLREDYSLFLADGTPVRATLTCSFTEALDPSTAGAASELHSSDVVRQRVVRRGDTLASIAQEMYQDASQWRVIADANAVYDPRDLSAWLGKPLIIPKLDAES